MIAFKRVVRIIEGEPGPVDVKLFEHETEKVLYAKFQEIEKIVRPLFREQKYAEALSEMAKLKPVVDKFFDDVMVNVEDSKLRRNRHALLAEIRAMFREFADFSKIVTAG
jgi:glycyl-tRNA synthetase beta chain